MIKCVLKTTDYRGDHTAEVAIAVEPLPNETVEAFAVRMLTGVGPLGVKNRAADWIEIRVPTS